MCEKKLLRLSNREIIQQNFFCKKRRNGKLKKVIYNVYGMVPRLEICNPIENSKWVTKYPFGKHLGRVRHDAKVIVIIAY